MKILDPPTMSPGPPQHGMGKLVTGHDVQILQNGQHIMSYHI